MHVLQDHVLPRSRRPSGFQVGLQVGLTVGRQILSAVGVVLSESHRGLLTGVARCNALGAAGVVRRPRLAGGW